MVLHCTQCDSIAVACQNILLWIVCNLYIMYRELGNMHRSIMHAVYH